MRDTPKLTNTETDAMREFLHGAGYEAYKCHLRRVNVLAMLWIAVNQLAAIKTCPVYEAYHTIYTNFLNLRKGAHFNPESVRLRAAGRLAKWKAAAEAASKVPVSRRQVHKAPMAARVDGSFLTGETAADSMTVPFSELSDPGFRWVLTQKSPQFTQFEANRSPDEGAGAIGAPGIGAGTGGSGTTGCDALGGSAGPWTGSGATMAGDSSRADGERLLEPTPPGGRDPAPTPTPLRTAQPPEN